MRGLVCLGLLLAGGCGVVVPVQVVNSSLTAWEAGDPNALGVTPAVLEDGGRRFEYEATFEALAEGTIPFWGHHYRLLEIPVARAEINGRVYPAVFDTGNSMEVTVIEDIHVRENDLPVMFFDADKTTGMALVREFEVGSLRAEDYPCVFLKHHTGIRFLGLPVGRSRHVILPLNLMRAFKYFAFDQVRREVRYSAAEAFEPADASQWVWMPFEVREKMLLLDVTVEGAEATLLLDTGAGLELELDERLYHEAARGRPDWGERTRRSWTYSPFSGVRAEVARVEAQRVRLGEWVLPEVEILYGRPYAEKPYQGIVGFELFRDTVMVVDFERGRVWVKKAAGSRFAP